MTLAFGSVRFVVALRLGHTLAVAIGGGHQGGLGAGVDLASCVEPTPAPTNTPLNLRVAPALSFNMTALLVVVLASVALVRLFTLAMVKRS